MISQKQIAKWLHESGAYKDAHVYIRDFEQIDDILLVDLRIDEGFGYTLTLSKEIPMNELEETKALTLFDKIKNIV